MAEIQKNETLMTAPLNYVHIHIKYNLVVNTDTIKANYMKMFNQNSLFMLKLQ